VRRCRSRHPARHPVCSIAGDPSPTSRRWPRTRQGSYPDLDTAIRELARLNLRGRRGVRAKAEALTELEIDAARAVLLENGDWDGGLADISDPATDGIPIWLIRGDPATGGLVPDAALPGFAARIGADHIITLAGAPHAPQRTHPADLTAALLRALD
jgi:pimeloyl-ACP methyl ester carboxylesterase